MTQNDAQKILLLRGLPGAGKTTFAYKWVNEDPAWRVRVNKDDIGYQNFRKWDGYTQHQIETIATLEHAQVNAALKAQLSVVMDDTNLDAKTVREWFSLAERYKVPIEVHDVATEIEDCIRRDSTRLKWVGEAQIRLLYSKFFRKGAFPALPNMDPKEAAKGSIYVPDESLPSAYLWDIDGTLARNMGRSPFDWPRVGEDALIEDVARVMQHLYDAGHTTLVMSGRDEVCRPETKEWLLRHRLKYDKLFMRWTQPDGEQKVADDIVKLELFDKNIRHNYNVVGVFDDRLRVCRMWEAIGLTLFRVGPLDSDF